ncbi:hypothetical protein GGS20DRAFT_309595 [Poronia punctata]|nr:hypothetical protein GGS20DRAFT_309595 [Poronia punctata]
MEPVTAQSILSRRPAAGGLSHFHLPLPNSSLDLQIPRVSGSDSLSPLSSSVNGGSSQSSQTGVSSYNNQNGWPIQSSSNNSYTYGSMAAGGQHNVMSTYNRHIYPPNAPGTPGTGGSGQTGYSSRNTQSSTSADDLSHPPYDSVSHPFPISMSGGTTGHSSFSHQSSHSQHMQHAMMGSQTSQPPTPVASSSSENYSRPPPTPSYYTGPSNTSQQSSFPSFPPPHHSPSQLSSTSAGGPLRGISALSGQPHLSMSAHSPYGNRHYYSTQVQQNLGGAVMSNLGNPSGQIHIMGGGGISPLSAYHHAHAIGAHHALYPGATGSHQERPYRCDTCPQSFNRNHDLKRHKRIHLAVKPFPCTHCEKAFSRKDALKRHMMVKQCGSHGKSSPKSDKDGSPLDDSKMDTDGRLDMESKMDYGEMSHSRSIKNEPV